MGRAVMAEDNTTFVKITNRHIYDKILAMDEKLEAIKIDQAKIKTQIRWHQLIGGFIITGTVGAFAFLFGWIKELGGK